MIKVNPNPPFVGSYHKTGTTLFKEIFFAYCLKKGFQIIFFENFHKISDMDLFKNKGLAIIRHPYEIVVSGLRYHLQGKEKWVYKANQGKTSYFEELKSLQDFEQQVNFETQIVACKTINAIYKDIKNKKNTLFIKLEEFWDVESRKHVAKKICDHLDLDIDIFMPIVLKKSKEKHNSTNPNFCHTWPKLLTHKNLEFINRLIPKDTLEVLGYK